MAKARVSNAECERQYKAAVRRGEDRVKTEPRALSVIYEATPRRLVVELSNGAVLMVPVDLLQGLRGAADDDLAAVELMPRGFDLHWPALDAQLTVAGLLRGVFGSKAWMAELGRIGGSVISRAKRAAARANGKLGGRPKGTKTSRGRPTIQSARR